MREIYLACNQKPIVSFSSCEGFNVAKLVAQQKLCPYHLITGSFKKIGFQDSIDGYYTFYTNLDMEKDFIENIKEVKDNFPNLGFTAYTSEQLFAIAWTSYMKCELTPEKIKERNENIITEFIARTGTIKTQQKEFLNNRFTNQATNEYYNRYRKIFFS